MLWFQVEGVRPLTRLGVFFSACDGIVMRLFRGGPGLLFAALLALGPGGAATAETPKAALQLTINDGLSQSTVSDILQAEDGRMWFATGDGISLYDGESFQYIYRGPGDAPGLTNNYTSSLAQDAAGLVWVGTLGGGVSVFDPSGAPVGAARKAQGLVGSDEVFDLKIDPDGRVWVASGEGVTVLEEDGEGRIVTAEGVTPPPLRTSVRSLALDPDGAVYLGTQSEGLYRYDPRSGALDHWEGQTSALEGRTVLDILAVGSDTVWIATEDAGLYRLDAGTGLVDRPLDLPDSDVEALALGQDGRLWIGTWSHGIFVHDPLTGALENYRSRRGVRQRISSDTILSLAPGALGRMWIGTYDNGASSVSQSPDLFETYYPRQSGVIWSFADDGRGGLLVGGKDGLLRLDRATRDLEVVPLVGAPGTDLGPAPHDVRAILSAPGGQLIAVREHGLLRRRDGEAVWTRVRGPDGAPVAEGAFIRLLLRARDDTLWIGTHSGVYHVAADGRLIAHHTDEDTPDSLPHNRTRSLFEAPDGTIWVGTSGGLSRWDAATGTFTTVSGPEVLPDDDVRAIWQERPGAPLYVGTQGGIVLLDADLRPIRRIGRAEGLPNETIYKILPDGRGGLWLTTNNGLARLDLATQGIDVFRTSDGLQGAEFNFNAGLVLGDGTIAVGGIDGFSLFDPAALRVDRTEPRVSAIWEDRPETPTAPFTIGATVRVIQYDKPGDNLLRWRLRPLEEAWTEARGVQHRIRYQNLPAGTYELDYEGVSAVGMTTDRVTTAFAVLPPLTQRWWAWVAYAALAALALAIASRLRTGQVEARNRKLEEVIGLKTAELARQNAMLESAVSERSAFYARAVHEIRTPLSLIRAPLDTILRQPDLPAEARRLATLVLRATARMTVLTEQMADAAATPHGLDPGRATVDLESFITPIVEVYRDLATERGLAWSDTVTATGAATLDHDALDAVLNNLLSNAVRHTPAGGSAAVRITTGASDLRIAVTNSAALPPDRVRRLSAPSAPAVPGKGVDIIARSVLRLRGQLSVDTSEGTAIEVTLPCDRTPAEGEAPASAAGPAAQADAPAILIVEDDSDLRQYLSDLLAPVGRIRTVASLSAARRAVDRHAIQLVLCDVMLPDGRAFDFARALKSEAATAHVGLIFLTALHDDTARQAAEEAWADDYLTKPFDPQEVLRKVRLRLRAATKVQDHVAGRLLPPDTPAATPLPPAPAPFDAKLLETFEACLDRSIADPGLRIEDVAGACGVSARVLQRQLDAHYGQSFTALLTERRMRHAAELLSRGTMSVTQVAQACGYTNLSSFSRRFKAAHGQSPRNYAP